jgi:hypothetical protein
LHLAHLPLALPLLIGLVTQKLGTLVLPVSHKSTEVALLITAIPLLLWCSLFARSSMLWELLMLSVWLTLLVLSRLLILLMLPRSLLVLLISLLSVVHCCLVFHMLISFVNGGQELLAPSSYALI